MPFPQREKNLPVDIVVEAVVACHGDDPAPCHSNRVENLQSCISPNLADDHKDHFRAKVRFTDTTFQAHPKHCQDSSIPFHVHQNHSVRIHHICIKLLSELKARLNSGTLEHFISTVSQPNSVPMLNSSPEEINSLKL